MTILPALWWFMRRHVTSLNIVVCFMFTIYIIIINYRLMQMGGNEVKKISPTNIHRRTLNNDEQTGSLKLKKRTLTILEDDILGNRTYFNVDVVRQDQLSRVTRLRRKCAGKEQELFGKSTSYLAYGRIEVDTNYKYLYCPVFKVASTFFRRLFYSVRQGKSFRGPYGVPIVRAFQAKRDVLLGLSPLATQEARGFLNSATSIMFVREPFARLLSGYVDKLFAPNPLFWGAIGKHIVSRYRGKGIRSNVPEDCGHDVTFAEFVHYVVHSEQINDKHRDPHFTPTYDQCKPCTLNYTFVGKMETFLPDIALALQVLLGQEVSKEKLQKWDKESTTDSIHDSIFSPWGWMNAITKCMSKGEALKRIWRKLQIRGILLLEDRFPWNDRHKLQDISVGNFVDKVNLLHSKADKKRLKRQKLEVLAEAFSTVEPQHIIELIQIFMPDFKLFDYDHKPDFIFKEDFVKQFRIKNFVFNLDTV